MILSTTRAGLLAIEFTEDEAELLALLARQVGQLVGDADGGPDDAVFARLFPEAYREDPDAAAEFRQYTRDGLREYKSDGSERIATALTLNIRVELDHSEADRWARSLTDIRILVGTRLGIDDDDATPEGLMGDIYQWLTQLQGAVIDALASGRVTS